ARPGEQLSFAQAFLLECPLGTDVHAQCRRRGGSRPHRASAAEHPASRAQRPFQRPSIPGVGVGHGHSDQQYRFAPAQPHPREGRLERELGRESGGGYSLPPCPPSNPVRCPRTRSLRNTRKAAPTRTATPRRLVGPCRTPNMSRPSTPARCSSSKGCCSPGSPPSHRLTPKPRS